MVPSDRVRYYSFILQGKENRSRSLHLVDY